MGRRGPRPKLDILDRLDGRPGKRRKQAAGGIQASGRPQVPDHLPAAAHGAFLMVLESMPPAVYAAADSYIISAFVMAWATHRQAVQAMATPGFADIVNGRVNPWLKLANNSARTMASLGDRLGLDPRARAALMPIGERAPTKFDGLLGGRTRS